MSDHLDTRLLEELRELMQDRFGELLEVFLTESSAQYQQLCQEWRAGAHDEVRLRAHSLKGSCANVGATGGAMISADLERLLRHASWEGVPALIEQLGGELELMREALERYRAGS